MSKKHIILGFALLLVAAGIAFASGYRDSLIVDEIPHIGAGYSYVAKGDMRLNPEHPPLAKDLAGLVLLPFNLNQSVFLTSFWLSDVNNQWEVGRKLIFNSGNDADKIRLLVKLPMLLFFISAGFLLFYWSYRLFGKVSAYIALVVFAFSPTIIAHARFVATDVPALWGVLFATYFFLRFLHAPTRTHLWHAGIALGLALLTKFSLLLLIPYFIILVLVRALVTRSKVLGLEALRIFCIAIFLIVFPIYFLQTYNYPSAKQHGDTVSMLQYSKPSIITETITWASDKPIIRALDHFALGTFLAGQRSAGGNLTYFFGDITYSSFRTYFPLVYAMKEPIPWLILLVVAVVGSLMALCKFNSKDAITRWIRENFAAFSLLLWVVIYWTVSISSNLNIGIRHLLPAYPFMIILVAGYVGYILKNTFQYHVKYRKFIVASVIVLLGWYIIETISVFPFYLAYFNEFAGGTSGGYRYVVDSNLDWGQDLIRLSDWVHANHIDKIETDYFGWSDPLYYMPNEYVWTSVTKYNDAQDFIQRNGSNGWIAVSATFLQNSSKPSSDSQGHSYAWLAQYQPVTVIGHSIFVYHLTSNFAVSK